MVLSRFESIDSNRINSYLDSDSIEFLNQILGKMESGEEITKNDAQSFKSLADSQQIVAGETEMLNISQKINNNETFDYLESKKELEAVLKQKLKQ